MTKTRRTTRKIVAAGTLAMAVTVTHAARVPCAGVESAAPPLGELFTSVSRTDGTGTLAPAAHSSLVAADEGSETGDDGGGDDDDDDDDDV